MLKLHDSESVVVVPMRVTQGRPVDYRRWRTWRRSGRSGRSSRRLHPTSRFCRLSPTQWQPVICGDWRRAGGGALGGFD